MVLNEPSPPSQQPVSQHQKRASFVQKHCILFVAICTKILLQRIIACLQSAAVPTEVVGVPVLDRVQGVVWHCRDHEEVWGGRDGVGRAVLRGLGAPNVKAAQLGR